MNRLTLVADVLNREYQSGGDEATLVRVADAIAATIPNPVEASHFRKVAAMGGLGVVPMVRCEAHEGHHLERVDCVHPHELVGY